MKPLSSRSRLDAAVPVKREPDDNGAFDVECMCKQALDAWRSVGFKSRESRRLVRGHRSGSDVCDAHHDSWSLFKGKDS